MHAFVPFGERIRRLGAEQPEAAALIQVDHRGGFSEMNWGDFAAAVAERAACIRSERDPAAPLVVEAAGTIEGVLDLVAALSTAYTVVPTDPEAPDAARSRLLEHVRSAATGAPGGYMLATGGSTGRPKLVHWPATPGHDPRNPGSLLLRRTGWRERQVQLLAGPLHHAAPFSRLLDGVLSGNRMVIPQLFRPSVVIEAIAKFGVEWAQLTPSHMGMLGRGLAADPDAFRTLRGVLHTAAPCPEATKRAWIAGLGGSRVHEMYTTTEGFGTTYCNGDEWLAHPGSVGRGFFTKIKIRGTGGGELAPGQVGTVYMRGVSRGGSVSGDAGALESPGRDGYATAGDRGRLDADGYLYLSGRREDLIIVGGQNVYAYDIESVICAREEVRDAVAVALSDDLFGERVCAVIALEPSSRTTAQDLLRHCAEHLPAYKCPQKIVIVPAIPTTAAGKTDRRAVRELAANAT